MTRRLALAAALVLALVAAPAAAQISAAQVVQHGTQFNINHAPAATTQATISQAASTTLRHVATSITVCLNAVAAQATPIVFNLRDGATGAGTVLWTARVIGAVNSTTCVVAPVYIVGTLNTAMTLESSAAPASTNFVTVSLTGFEYGG